MEVAVQLSLHFPCGKWVTWKTKTKTLNISNNIQSISSSFHQNDHTVAGQLILVPGDFENVGQGQSWQKFSFLKCEYF